MKQLTLPSHAAVSKQFVSDLGGKGVLWVFGPGKSVQCNSLSRNK